jgi:hypothetical protein
MHRLCIAVLPLLAHAYVLTGGRAQAHGRLRAHVRADADYDPFSSPRGPPPDQMMPRPDGAPPARRAAPEDPEEGEIRVGARVVGSVLGGISGNRLYTGIRGALGDCSPFNLQACEERTSSVARPPSGASVTASTGSDAFAGNPIAEILRNPTSILPSDWKLEGRRYIDETVPQPVPPLPLPPPPMAWPPAAPLAAPPPIAPVAPPMPLPPPPPLDLAQPSEPSLEELRQQYETMQKQLQLQLEQLRSQAPIGVPPAAAAEPLPAMHADTTATAHAAVHSLGDAPIHAAHAPSVLDVAAFGALADGGGGGGVEALIATVASAAVGAIFVEALATNKDAPLPDPLLGGVWGSLHAGARFTSKYVGGAAVRLGGVLKGVLPF